MPLFMTIALKMPMPCFSILFKIVGFPCLFDRMYRDTRLTGMGVYTAETRLKEISIRKVLGATEQSLVKLLSGSFMLLLIIAAAIAIPMAYFLFDAVILADIAHKAPIGVFELTIGVVIILRSAC